jgi:transcriptional regulator with XRE-family HTH domain
MTLSESVSAEVRAELARRKLTQNNLAKALCVSPEQVSLIVNGRRDWTLNLLHATASFLGLNLLDLINASAGSAASAH